MMALLLLGCFSLLLGIGVAASALIDLKHGVIITEGARGLSRARIVREDDPELFNQFIMLDFGFAALSAVAGIVCLWITVRMAWPRPSQRRGLF
jgi:uncharacterized membrane protein SpoIIM required for sporulation